LFFFRPPPLFKPFDTSIVNYNALSLKEYQLSYDAMMKSDMFVMGRAGKNELINYAVSQEDHDKLHADTDVSNVTFGLADNHPHSPLIYPVHEYQTIGTNRSKVVAMIVSVLPWDNYLKHLLPQGVNGIYCILKNSCGQEFTYLVNGNDATFLGVGDQHDPAYDGDEFLIPFNEFLGKMESNTSEGDCSYWFAVYPSSELHATYETNTPVIFTVVVASTFFLMAITFIIYDFNVVRKNNKIMNAAAQSSAIVSVR